MLPARVLIVDDDVPLCALTSAVLRKGGFDVDVAAGGSAALQKIGLVSYDAILLDLMMPGVSGLDVLACLEENGKSTPVILISAARPARLQSIQSANIHYTLHKPFNIIELLAAVRNCVAVTPRTGAPWPA